MNIKNLWWWAFPLLCITSITCTREYVEDLRGVCFDSDVLPIFQSNCTQSGCHNSQDRKEGYDLTSYESIVSRGIVPGDYKASKIYKALVAVGEPMPQSPYNRLTDAQITTIALWIKAGAAHTTCSDTTLCDTSNPKFSTVVSPILQTYCNGCHGGTSPLGNVDYNTYAGVKATVTNGKLMGSIKHTSGFSAMPQNANKLSDCKISVIQAWIDAGAPNN
ncbi:MAG TPA: hypothetical protein PLO67_12585 [Saprospiraceae bacterium]|nr:hypothetical protein [Saprospiraceae bacterium]HPI07448.1 hypothetical protein [Saprospiraceae bacterium]